MTWDPSTKDKADKKSDSDDSFADKFNDPGRERQQTYADMAGAMQLQRTETMDKEDVMTEEEKRAMIMGPRKKAKSA